MFRLFDDGANPLFVMVSHAGHFVRAGNAAYGRIITDLNRLMDHALEKKAMGSLLTAL